MREQLDRVIVVEGGGYRTQAANVCDCAKPRGPAGGVCGQCSGAIPSPIETLMLADRERARWHGSPL